MKKFLLFFAGACLLIFIAIAVSSCTKTYTCKCTGGLTYNVKATSKAAAKTACINQGSGCTLE